MVNGMLFPKSWLPQGWVRRFRPEKKPSLMEIQKLSIHLLN